MTAHSEPVSSVTSMNSAFPKDKIELKVRKMQSCSTLEKVIYGEHGDDAEIGQIN
jgi:hypothetical protein